MSLFGGSSPKPPPPPPPPPTTEDPAVQAERAKIAEQNRKRRGRGATMLTDPRSSGLSSGGTLGNPGGTGRATAA